ncbi:MAG: guanylate kinase [Deltaproteobacteria bacterium]|nr:guanylate kinase [Deltaproteobacteria bacterium]
MKRSGSVFVVSGPSGAGKSSIIRRVRGSFSSLAYSVSHTSRKPRAEEVDGVDYHFVSRESFIRMVERGEFVEWAKVYGDCYGTSILSIERATSEGFDVIMDVDVQGAANIKARFQGSILVYILPPSLEELSRRLKNRGTESDEEVRARFEKAAEEIRNCRWYDYLIFNDDLMQAAEAMKSVIIAEQCRWSRQLPEARKLFDLCSS